MEEGSTHIVVGDPLIWLFGGRLPAQTGSIICEHKWYTMLLKYTETFKDLYLSVSLTQCLQIPSHSEENVTTLMFMASLFL